jgi:hypothetical protein
MDERGQAEVLKVGLARIRQVAKHEKLDVPDGFRDGLLVAQRSLPTADESEMLR